MFFPVYLKEQTHEKDALKKLITFLVLYACVSKQFSQLMSS